MNTTNTIRKIFGPVGSFAGIIIALAGVALSFYSLGAVILVLFGALVGFSTVKTSIDTEKHRIRHYQSYFGLINIGKWKNIDPGMKLVISKDNRTYRSYSRSNRPLDLKSTGFIIMLQESSSHRGIPVARKGTRDTAEEEMDKLSRILCVGIQQ